MARRLVVAEARDDDRDAHADVRRLAVDRRPLDAVAQAARRARCVAAFSASPPRPSTRLAVRAALAAWSTAQAASISCHTTSAVSSSHHSIPISSADAWPRSSRAAAASSSPIRGRVRLARRQRLVLDRRVGRRGDADRRAAGPGSATGTLRLHLHRHRSSACARSSRPCATPSAGPRSAALRYGGSCRRRRVVSHGELARALARGVAGERRTCSRCSAICHSAKKTITQRSAAGP